MLPNHTENIIEDIANLDVAQCKGFALDSKHQVLHLEREDFLINDSVRLAATIDHQVAGAVAIELGNGLEEIEEVCAVGGVERGDEAGVDEDELGSVAVVVDGGESGGPGVGLVAVGTEAFEDAFGDVDGGGEIGGLLLPAKGEVELLRFIEADHHVARVEIGVDKVVDQEHAEESVQALVGNLLLEYTSAVFEKVSQGNALGVFLDEDLSSGEIRVGIWKPCGGAVLEILPEQGEISRLDAKIELKAHHLAKLLDFVGKGEPLKCWNGIENSSKGAHDFEIPPNKPLYLGMKDFDGDIGGWDSMGCTFDQNIDVLPNSSPQIVPFNDGVLADCCKIGPQSCLVDLSNRTHS